MLQLLFRPKTFQAQYPRTLRPSGFQGISFCVYGLAAFLVISAGVTFVSADDDELLADEDLLTSEELLSDDELLLEDDSLLDEGDDLLGDEEDLSGGDGEEGTTTEEDAGDVAEQAAEEHESLFAESRYPSAGTCGTCHPKQYEAWSVSQHSYSQLSPAYLSLNNKINELANGSNGDFCLRGHNAVGSNLGEDSFTSNL